MSLRKFVATLAMTTLVFAIGCGGGKEVPDYGDDVDEVEEAPAAGSTAAAGIVVGTTAASEADSALTAEVAWEEERADSSTGGADGGAAHNGPTVSDSAASNQPIAHARAQRIMKTSWSDGNATLRHP